MNTPADKVNRSSTVTHQRARSNPLFRGVEQGTFFRPSAPFIQPRLNVSQPGDPQELEAEQTADRIMQMPKPAVSVPGTHAAPEPRLQREEEPPGEQEEPEEKVQPAWEKGPARATGATGSQPESSRNPGAGITTGVQRASGSWVCAPLVSRSPVVHRRHCPYFRSDVVQRAGRGPPAHGSVFESQLQQTKGTGVGLPDATRSFMETRFQSDFSGVRVHTGATAQAMSKSIHAQAFTHGGDIYFNSGRYDPDSAAGRRLLAHELTHTIQQGASPGMAQISGDQASAARTISRSVESRRTIQRQAAVPQLDAAVAKARGEEGKVNANLPGPDGNRTGWERLLEYFKTSMGEDKVVPGTGGYVPGTVSEQVIKKKSQALGQVANQPPDVVAMRDAMPSWCGIFVFWALNKGGVPMPKWELGGPAIKREAAYPPGHTPVVGDIAYRNANSHYALVEKSTGGGSDADVTTVNGNTAGEDNLGGQIQSRSHKLSDWTGFFNPLVLMQGSLRSVEDPDAKPKTLRELRRELFNVSRFAEDEHEEPASHVEETTVQAKTEGEPKTDVPSDADSRIDRSDEQEPELEEEEPATAVQRLVQTFAGAGLSRSPEAGIEEESARASISEGANVPTEVALLPFRGAEQARSNPLHGLNHARGPPSSLSRCGERIQCSWLSDAWDAVSGFASEAAQWIEEGLDAAKRWLLRKVRDFVREIPGYQMLSFILAEDPITGERVERNGRNLLYAGLDILPAGGLFRTVIERIGAVDDLAAYLDTRISDLSSLASGIIDQFSRFWDGISLDDVGDPEGVFNRVADVFRSTLQGIESFITRAAVDFLELIKDILLREIVEFIRARIPRLYPLLTVALGHDPVTNEEVERNGTNILNAILEVSEEGREQRRQMQETGTFERIAGFIDRGIAVFTTAYQQLRQAFNNLWDFVTIEALVSPVETFTQIYDQFSAPVTLVTDYIVDVAVEILRVIKEVLMARLSAYARTVRGYALVTVLIGRDPFTGEVVPRNIENIIRGFMSLMEGGEEQFQQMKESGAIAQTTARINAAVARLNMTPAYIVQLFTDLWSSFSLSDLAQPVAAFQRIMATFGEPIGRLIAFVIEIVRIVVEVILRIMNFPIDLIGNIITKTREAFELIKRDPAGFLKNLLRAIKQGFIQFFDNILQHLINGVVGWLMAELRDAGVPVLTDFSLQGVIGWVLEVLGISMEKIWEKLAAHPRIGPERVARIRSMINSLEGIWTFIKDVQERGMAAIWDRIQERLSSLWDTVLDAVKNWIMEKIITAVVTKLLSMLDPTGIMAVINSAIAIYRAVQSFIRYLTEMLQVVNSFVEGVVEIASGSVARAANALEAAMDRAMPVVIGFLANQVGLGGVGRRVGEMIERVREMVDQALTWLVNRAVDTGMALLDRAVALGRSAVSAVTAWAQGLLGLQRPFTTADNASHRIYYAQQGDTVKLMLNPAPAGEYETAINQIQPPAPPGDRVEMASAIAVPLQRNNAVVSTIAIQPESDGKIGMGTLKSHAIRVAQHIDGLINSRRRTSSDPSQQAVVPGAAAGATGQTADFTASLEGLSRITSLLLSAGAAGSTGPLPVTPVPAYGGLSNGYATRMDVKPLTKLGVPGSTVSVDSPGYSNLLLRRETPGGRSFFIAGHLLNNNVHGSGTTWQNLTPIAQRTNQQHESRVESKVKEAVDKDLILQYTVDVDYGMPRKDNLLQEIELTPNWQANSVLSEKHRIIEAEAALPLRLRCAVKQLKLDGTDLDASDPAYDPGYNISGAAGTIDNAGNVPQNSLDNYYLSSATAVTYIDFATLRTEALAASTSTSPQWEAFYNNAARKVSIDNLSPHEVEQLRNVFRREDLLNDERSRIDLLERKQNWETFQGGRTAYTGGLLSTADIGGLETRFDQKVTALKAAFLSAITVDVNTNITDPNTRWGDFRNTRHLAANLDESEITTFKTTVFDPKIAALEAAAASAPEPAGP